MKALLLKIRGFLPLVVALVVSVGLLSLTLYGAYQLVARLTPSVVVSGSSIALHQKCLEKQKDKDGKETCAQKGPLKIYVLEPK